MCVCLLLGFALFKCNNDSTVHKSLFVLYTIYAAYAFTAQQTWPNVVHTAPSANAKSYDKIMCKLCKQVDMKMEAQSTEKDSHATYWIILAGNSCMLLIFEVARIFGTNSILCYLFTFVVFY